MTGGVLRSWPGILIMLAILMGGIGWSDVLVLSELKVTADDAGPHDYFGRSVSVSGNRALVGSTSEATGAVYLWEEDPVEVDLWLQTLKLLPSDGAAGDEFGYSVSLDADTAAVGAVDCDAAGTDSGAVYVFGRNWGGPDSWGEVAKLTGSDIAPGDGFGYSVSLQGDRLVVGAEKGDGAVPDSGAAYVFERDYGGTDNWGEVAKLEATDGALNDSFGVSVAIDADRVLVGARYDDDWGAGSGSAYLFERNWPGPGDWGQRAKLIPQEEDARSADYFGISASISGDIAVVGAYYDDDDGSQSGSAYIFQDLGDPNSWAYPTKLTASDAATGHQFGVSAELKNDTVIIGARYHDQAGSQSGAAYLYRRDHMGFGKWGEIARLQPFDAAEGDQFGSSVSLWGDIHLGIWLPLVAAVGSNADDDGGTNSGSAYVFSLPIGICGDADNDWQVNQEDVDALRNYLADPVNSPLGIYGLSKCSVIGTPFDCDVNDLIVLRRELADPALGPGIQQVCDPLPAHCSEDWQCDDGVYCNGVEACVGEVCSGGSAVDCSDGVFCTSDVCIEVTQSCQNNPYHSLCEDDVFCNGLEFCDPVLDCQVGAPVDCDDFIDCTWDHCNETTNACDHDPRDFLCVDDVFCDGDETCNPLSGCLDGPGDPCPPDVCDETRDICVECYLDQHCDDGLYCTGDEVCISDVCQTIPRDCGDGVGCSIDTCNEGTDSCDHAPDHVFCDNGQHCDGVESCDVLLDCQVGTPPDCDDGVSCTVDACNETTDSCDHPADDGLCQNGQYCDGVESCDVLLDCQAGPGDPCLPDVCDETRDICVECYLDQHCDDGLYCTGDEVCVSDVCTTIPRDCGDGVGCSIDTCNEGTDSCDHAPDHAFCSNGQYCDGVESCDVLLDCQAGAPVDCNDGVGCTVDACNEVADVCDHPADDGLCQNGVYCDGVESCDVLLDCQAGPGDPCLPDVCDEANDGCVECLVDADCDDGVFCNGDEVCDAFNSCQNVPRDCSDGVGCSVDTCNEGTDSCDHAPDHVSCDNAQYCDGVESCDLLLDCQAGTPVDCDDAVGCTIDSCNEGTDSCDNGADDGLCDDGFFCNGPETCDALFDCQAGVLDLDDGVGCTVDICNEATDTVFHLPNNPVCDNGAFCDGVESCDVLLDCQAGAAVDCSDGVSCTVDACNEATDSCDHPADDGLCQNGLYCDGVESCDALLDCQVGTPVSCGDGVGCTVDACNEATDSCDNTPNGGFCDNGLYCDGAESCDAVLDCQLGAAVDCGDGVGCTADSCNEGTDSCDNAANDAVCDDGFFCNGPETCDALLDCQAGVLDLDDAVDCTVDICNEPTDTILHLPNNGFCDNGAFCDGVESCDVLLDCQAGTAVDCGDGVGCTTDLCNEGADSCESTADDGLCDNGLYCDGAETCDVLLDCQPGTAVDCVDGVGCTTDLCNEGTDSCDNTADDAVCQNGVFCDGAETCDVVLDCQAGPGDPCLPDSCDELGDVCVECLIDADCDDGLFCSGDEVCSASNTCQTVPRDCGDGVGCTIDACNETTDSCDNTADDGLCDNSLYCDGAESCDALLDCQAGTAVDCGDGVGCTVDSCNESTDSCDNTPSDPVCDNGFYCDGVETCDALLDCQAGTAVDCGDGVGCTSDACNETTESCDNTADDGLCDNSLYCDGVESCDALLDCQAGTAVDCADGVGCTSDACNETTDSCDNTTDDGLCDNGQFCDGAESCDALLDCQGGSDPCGGAVCHEAQDVCQVARIETVSLTVGGSPITVPLANAYVNPVVVCSVQYQQNVMPVVARVSNVTSTSFDVRLQNPSDGPVVAEGVDCLVVEEGVWTIDGTRLEAWTYQSTVTDSSVSWVGETQAYGQSYLQPVVLGQVMTENDASWSVFWSRGSSRSAPPSATDLWTGKTVGEDVDRVRVDETIGVIVFEAGHGTMAGAAFEAALGADTVMGVADSPPYIYFFSSPFASAPEVAVATMAGMDGYNGGWAQVHGPTQMTTSLLYLSIDEDQIGDAERNHTSEQVAYIVFESAFAFEAAP